MPFIKMELDSASKEQKKELIEKVTADCSSILNMDPASFLVLIKENSTDNWGLGGTQVTELLNK